MAEPMWTSRDDPAYTVEGTVVTANAGNWQQGRAFPAERLNEPRYVYIWTAGGQTPWGQPPPKSSPPEQTFMGEKLRSFDAALLGPGTLLVFGSYPAYFLPPGELARLLR